MRIYLVSILRDGFVDLCQNAYVLESFYYMNSSMRKYFPLCKDVLIDSGAFSFMSGTHEDSPDFDSYASRYADFLIENNIENYFELDIDSIKDISYVEKIRSFLERRTGKPSIPVWHKSRGIDYFKRMCCDYPYVAIGGIVNKEIKRNEFAKLMPLVDYAHGHGCKIHGLGFTSLKWIDKIHFDSVDSTAWCSSSKFGNFSKFDSITNRIKYQKFPGKRIKSSKLARRLSLQEWIKFQHYAEKNL